MPDNPLYYYVVRRFPPIKQLSPRALDKYCKTLLKNKVIFERVKRDYQQQLESHSWLDYE